MQSQTSYEGQVNISYRVTLHQENQVMALKEQGVAAEYLSSTQTSQVRNKVMFIVRILHCESRGFLEPWW